MMAAGTTGGGRTRRTISARTARVLLAAAASLTLTSVVAVPLAFQAHEARESPTPTLVVEGPPPSVLGTSTVPTPTSSTSTTLPD